MNRYPIKFTQKLNKKHISINYKIITRWRDEVKSPSFPLPHDINPQIQFVIANPNFNSPSSNSCNSHLTTKSSLLRTKFRLITQKFDESSIEHENWEWSLKKISLLPSEARVSSKGLYFKAHVSIFCSHLAYSVLFGKIHAVSRVFISIFDQWRICARF